MFCVVFLVHICCTYGGIGVSFGGSPFPALMTMCHVVGGLAMILMLICFALFGTNLILYLLMVPIQVNEAKRPSGLFNRPPKGGDHPQRGLT